MPGRPDYRVVAQADADDSDSRLVEIGVAWESTTRGKGARYISVVLHARPWGEWDGRLQLHPIPKVNDD